MSRSASDRLGNGPQYPPRANCQAIVNIGRSDRIFRKGQIVEVNGYVLEFDRGGQRVYWPEALPAGVAFAAAGQMRRDGLNPKIIRISICARILSSGIVVTEPHAKRNTE